MLPEGASREELAAFYEAHERGRGTYGKFVGGYILSMEVSKLTVDLDEPVDLTLTSTFLTSYPTFARWVKAFPYQIEVLDEGGLLVPFTEEGRKRFGSFGSIEAQTVSVSADEEVSVLRNINAYFNIAEVGKYQVRVWRYFELPTASPEAIAARTALPSQKTAPKYAILSSNQVEISVDNLDKSKGEEKAGFELSIKSDRRTYLPGSVRVILTGELRNVGRRPVWMYDRHSGSSYTMTVTRGDGTVLPMTDEAKKRRERPSPFDVDRGGLPRLGSSQGLRLFPYTEYMLNQPGKYRLQLQRDVPSLEDSDKMVAVKSNVIEFTIEAALPPKAPMTIYGAETEGFQLSAEIEKPRITVGEAIDLNVLFQDLDRKQAALEFYASAYQVEAFDSEGRQMSLTPEGKLDKELVGGYTGPQAVYNPKSQAAFRFRINRMFDFAQPGKYQLRVSRQVPSRDDPKKLVTLTSNSAQLLVEAPHANAATGKPTAP